MRPPSASDPANTQQAALRRERLATAAAITALVVLLAGAAWATYFGGGQDFRAYYAAARVLAHGGDPYDFRQIGQEIALSTDQWSDHRFFNPPWLALAVLPLAQLPYDQARVVWLAANLCMLTAGFWLWRRVNGWPPWDWRAYLLGVALLFPLGWVALKTEQITIGLAFCLGLATVRGSKLGDLVAGLGMALLLTKPNVTFAPLMLIFLVLLRAGRWRALGAAAVVTIALLGIGTAVMPDWWRNLGGAAYGEGLWNVLAPTYDVIGVRIHATMLAWLTAFGVPQAVGQVIVVVAGSLLARLLYLAARGRLSAIDAAAWGALAGFLITPYAFWYDYILMAPLMIILWRGTSVLTPWRLATALGLWAAFYAIPFWAKWMNEVFWVPLIFVALGLVTGALPAVLSGRRPAPP